jgi:hypothetical protein
MLTPSSLFWVARGDRGRAKPQPFRHEIEAHVEIGRDPFAHRVIGHVSDPMALTPLDVSLVDRFTIKVDASCGELGAVQR